MAVRVDPNVVENISLEGSDERNQVVIKISDTGEEPEEVAFNKFFQWNPKFLTTVIND